jgi:tRNA dimethylallyltransferase
MDGPSLEALPDLSNSISPLLVIVGPTASGKSALALNLAQQFPAEIVNCDSLQVYRGMDIGTAKPTLKERQSLPHFLFDVRNPDQVFTAGEYSRIARPVLREISSRQHLPIVIGGAGFYLKALLEGLFPGPLRSEAVRERLMRLEQRKTGALHRVLNCWDATSASRIHSNDVNRLIRALEVIIAERQPLVAAYRKERNRLEGFRTLKIGLRPDRAALRSRIGERTRQMFTAGLLDEVRYLRTEGYGPEAKAMEAVGYRQAHAVIDGQLTTEQAIEETALRTSQYAKRQMTWFRRDPEIVWFEGFGDDSAVQALARSHLNDFFTDPINFSSH